MALFSLRSQHTGIVREFTLLDLLNAMGDTVNDEIRFPDGNREDVFNLSSFQYLGSGADGSNDTGGKDSGGSGANTGSTGATKFINEALPFTEGQQAVNLGAAPVSICMIYRNGIKIRQGVDYNKSGRTIFLMTPLRANEPHPEFLEAFYDAVA